MSFWDALAISPTVEVKKIKLAYAMLIKQMNPDDDPEGFQNLREAYEACLAESRRLKHECLDVEPQQVVEASDDDNREPVQSEDQQSQFLRSDADDKPFADTDQLVQALVDEFVALYKNFHQRIDAANWQRLLHRDVLQRIDVKWELGICLFPLLGEYPNLPKEVYSLLDGYFNWSDHQFELARNLPDQVLRHVFWRIHHATFKHDYRGLKDANQIDFDQYIGLREEGAHLLAQNEIEKAEPLLAQANAIYSQDPVLLFLMGQLAERCSDEQMAFDQYGQMIAAAPERIEGYLYRASIFLMHGEEKSAFGDFQRIIELDPNNVFATKGLAQCHERMGNFEEARLLFELSLDMQPADFEAIIALEMLNEKLIQIYSATEDKDIRLMNNLADCYVKANQPQKAIKLLAHSLIKDAESFLIHGKAMELQEVPWEEVEALYQQGLKIAKQAGENGYDLLMASGKLFYDHDDYTNAALAYKQAWEISPDNAEVAHLMAYNICYSDDGRDEEALAWVDQAITIDPGRYVFRKTKGHILYYNGRYAEAIPELDIYINTRYNAPFERYAKGMCHYWVGQHKEAAESLRMAQKMDRKDADLPFFLAISYVEIGQLEKAHEQINLYKEGCWDKYFWKGKIEIALGQTDQALASFRIGGDQFKSWECYAGMVCCYIRQADYQNAGSLLKSLNKYTTDDPWTLFHLAAVHCLNKQWHACLETADHYLQICSKKDNPIDTDVYYYRALACYHSNNINQAVEEGEKACSPNSLKIHIHLLVSMLHYEVNQIDQSIQRLVALGRQGDSLQLQALLSTLRKSTRSELNAKERISFEVHFPDIKKIVAPQAKVDDIPTGAS